MATIQVGLGNNQKHSIYRNPTNLKRRLQPAAKNLKAKYNNLSTKERVAKKNMPHSEIVKDQQGNTKTSSRSKSFR